jgi:hypothetical protein
MLWKATFAVIIAANLTAAASAAPSAGDQQAYEAMTGCFADKARSLDDLTTPLVDMADVIVGMCWEEVNQHRRRWTDDWGVDWAAFVGPYFTLQVTTKAKEAVYTYRITRRK